MARKAAATARSALPAEAGEARSDLEEGDFRALFECFPDAVVVTDERGRVVAANPAFEGLLERSATTTGTHSPHERVLPELIPDGDQSGSLPPGGARREGEVSLRLADGSVRSLEFVAVADFVPGLQLSVIRQGASRKRLEEGLRSAEELLRHHSVHDMLTGLPNRLLLLERLGHWLDDAPKQARAAVLFVDLDNFKLVNDGLGHDVGDQLLLAVAPRLSAAIRPSDVVARFGGDEFVLFCEGVRSEHEGVAIAQRVLRAFAEPFAIGEHEYHVTASIGIALAHPGTDANAVIRDADAAMYRAKEKGRAGYELFDEEMRVRVLERVTAEADMRRALREDELRVVYQPVVHFEGEVVGAEALLRWDDPQKGAREPTTFIPLAEENGLIVPIGEWVLRRACAQASSWRREGRGITVSVNLSPRQLVQPGFVDLVGSILKETGLPAPSLCVEVTEGAVMEAHGDPAGTLRALQKLGIRIAVDDFGTGRSSLSYLKDLPVDVVKLDRSFVTKLATKPEERAIVAAVVSLAEVLGLTVIAEGVETADQLAELRGLGCEFLQGFYFGRPCPAEELTFSGFSSKVQRGLGDPFVIREFMRQIGIPAKRIS